jgi:hypothetical protein
MILEVLYVGLNALMLTSALLTLLRYRYLQITSTRSRMKNLCLKLFKFFYPYCNLAYAIFEVGYDIKYAYASRGEWRWWMPLVGVSVIRDDGSISAMNVSDAVSVVRHQ